MTVNHPVPGSSPGEGVGYITNIANILWHITQNTKHQSVPISRLGDKEIRNTISNRWHLVLTVVISILLLWIGTTKTHLPKGKVVSHNLWEVELNLNLFKRRLTSAYVFVQIAIEYCIRVINSVVEWHVYTVYVGGSNPSSPIPIRRIMFQCLKSDVNPVTGRLLVPLRHRAVVVQIC